MRAAGPLRVEGKGSGNGKTATTAIKNLLAAQGARAIIDALKG